MKRSYLLALTLTVGLLLVPMAASADSHEQPKPLTWLSYAKAKTGMGGPLGMHMAEGGKKLYDPLMADGHILDWGVAQPINHRPGDEWTHVEWVTFRDWAAIDSFMGSFMAMQMAKSPEELKAEQEKWYSVVVPGSHFDEVLQHEAIYPGDGSRPAYFSLGYHNAKPGGGEALPKLFEEYGKPVLSKLQQAGTIGSYGLAATVLHGGTEGSHVFWYAMPNLAARGAVDKAFEAAATERGPEAQKELMGKFAAAVDFEAHHDRIMVVTHFGGGSGGGDGDDDGGGEDGE